MGEKKITRQEIVPGRVVDPITGGDDMDSCCRSGRLILADAKFCQR